jgi:UDP-N-acetylglucosamine 4,6-dehydratase/5-epimerase
MQNFKNILITGGTGTFGQSITRRLLNSPKLERLIIYSRDEMKHWAMMNEHQNDPRLRFFVGDVRDLQRLKRALRGVDLVIHAAAMKIVPLAEYNPMECIKTNINGAMNVIEASLDMGVDKVIALSTDKASSPINLYGATKLASDKLFVAGNNYSGDNGTSFCVVRYGNVMGSRGSVIPFFDNLDNTKLTPVTDTRMTRFMITIDQGIDLVENAANVGVGGEIFVRKIPSMNIVDIARAIRPDCELEIVGIRPGEKLHEQMIGLEDARNTIEFNQYFKIIPEGTTLKNYEKMSSGGHIVNDEFTYRSDCNDDWMSVLELRQWYDTYKNSKI